MHGPAGTHKLALGLNLGICYVIDSDNDTDNTVIINKADFKKIYLKKCKEEYTKEFQRAKLLVITFGGQGEIDWKGVAWLKRQGYLAGLIPIADQQELKGTKAELREYNANNYTAIIELSENEAKCETAKRAEVAVLTFQIGVLTPEECIHGINRLLKQQPGDNRFHSVLISDTAELCTGFPLLGKDPMFFAALLDLFESNKLLTVGLGVTSADSPNLREINLALLAKATHRMKFSHSPTIEELMEGMIDRDLKKNLLKVMTPDNRKIEEAKELLNEQVVSVVIDNVTGKHYKREPKWVRVNDKQDPKLLECLPFMEFNIEWLKQKEK